MFRHDINLRRTSQRQAFCDFWKTLTYIWHTYIHNPFSPGPRWESTLPRPSGSGKCYGPRTLTCYIIT